MKTFWILLGSEDSLPVWLMVLCAAVLLVFLLLTILPVGILLKGVQRKVNQLRFGPKGKG